MRGYDIDRPRDCLGRWHHDREDEAKLTLAELNEWLYVEIAGQYPHTIHRMIGTTPAAAWVKSLARGLKMWFLSPSTQVDFQL